MYSYPSTTTTTTSAYNYYPAPQQQEDRLMSYSDLLSCSTSSQTSDYERSPCTEDYHPMVTVAAGQQQVYYPGFHDYYQQHYESTIQKQQDLQHFMMMQSPIYNHPYHHQPQQQQQQKKNTTEFISSPCSTTISSCHTSPVIAQETLKKKKRSPIVKRIPSISTQESQKSFPCIHNNCGKVFKRSEHLKRHVRSIHTKEKRKLPKYDFIYISLYSSLYITLAYQCPYEQCGKRFSRSDNLSQHIRIHRTTKDRHHALTKKQKLLL